MPHSQIKRILKENRHVAIDLKGGVFSQKGFITVNSQDLPGVDLVLDLEKYPWPFPSNCADLLISSHLINHLNRNNRNVIRFFDEAWRVLKPKGQFMISAPYGLSYQYIQDPTNTNPVNEAFFCYFDPFDQMSKGELYKVYRPMPWKMVTIAFKQEGNLEVLLEKRPDDRSYHE